MSFIRIRQLPELQLTHEHGQMVIKPLKCCSDSELRSKCSILIPTFYCNMAKMLIKLCTSTDYNTGTKGKVGLHHESRGISALASIEQEVSTSDNSGTLHVN